MEMLVAAFRGMVGFQEKMAPMQDKIMKYVKRELEDLDESENWKADDEDQDEVPRTSKDVVTWEADYDAHQDFIQPSQTNDAATDSEHREPWAWGWWLAAGAGLLVAFLVGRAR